jgi:ligand-binding SRPBCC domain-containing protein
MRRLSLEIRIAAPVARCFDLSRSIDLHVESASATRERAVAGVTTGLIGLGESVTWRGAQFGIAFTATSEITEFERPARFVDRMVRGPFAHFEHEHRFEVDGEATLMRDVLDVRSPWGPLGSIVDRVIVVRHLRGFLEERNRVIKGVAESADQWQRYIGVEHSSSHESARPRSSGRSEWLETGPATYYVGRRGQEE